MGKAKCNERGFTLIEVLIALTVFAVGLLALAGMQITAIKGNAASQTISAKLALADGVIEEFLAMDGNDSQLNVAAVDVPWPSATNVDIEGAGTCSATVSVTPDPDINGVTYEGLTKIEVEVNAPTQNSGPVIRTVMKRRY